MLSKWGIGRFWGIGLYIHSTFWILPLYVFISGLRETTGLELVFQMALFFGVIACVIFHEFGHCLAARFFGIGTRDITLYPIGGVARLDRMSEDPYEELVISLAGPLVNFFLAGALFPFWLAEFPLEMDFMDTWEAGPSKLGLLVLYARLLCLANVVLLGFNLLPIFPMDGGRILRALLSWWLGLIRGTRLAATIGFFGALAIMLVGLFLGQWMMMILGFFVLLAGKMELSYLEARWLFNSVGDQGPRNSPVMGQPGFFWDQTRQAWVQWDNGEVAASFSKKSERPE